MTDPSPRAAVVASLASTLSRAVALGDEVAARVVIVANQRTAPTRSTSAISRMTSVNDLRRRGECSIHMGQVPQLRLDISEAVGF